MSISKLEQETIINFNEEENTAMVYTYNKKLKNRLEKYCAEYPSVAKKIRDDGTGGITYEIPKATLRVIFAAPYTEERRQAARQRAIDNNSADRLRQRIC